MKLDADPVIEMRDVYKAFGGNTVLSGVDLAVRPGETFTILGGSGSGKSVCLKHMIGLLRPDRGHVFTFGEDLTTASERTFVEVRKNASMIFQSGALFDSLPVFENIAYPLREHHAWDEEQVALRVRECLEAVGLEGVEERMPAELSGGMRKRVAVARGIAIEPAVILYDEPTTGLDPANQRRIGELIQSLQRRLGNTSIIVTHELELCFEISDRVALLKRGRIVAMGPADEIRNSRDRDVVDFLDGAQEYAPEDLHEAVGAGPRPSTGARSNGA